MRSSGAAYDPEALKELQAVTVLLTFSSPEPSWTQQIFFVAPVSIVVDLSSY